MAAGDWEVIEAGGWFTVVRGAESFVTCPCCGQKMDLDAARKLVSWLKSGDEDGRLEVARKLQALGRVIVERRGKRSWSGI